jgi:uncharacterized membrane-anchored protein
MAGLSLLCQDPRVASIRSRRVQGMTQQTNPTAVNLLNKVPEITIFFWIIKMMSTTIGETGADYLNVDWRLGLTGTAVVTGMLLALALFFQIKAKRFVPSLYWVSVLLISVFGTLVTDNLSDNLGCHCRSQPRC